MGKKSSLYMVLALALIGLPAQAGPYSDAVIADGPVAYYQFEDADSCDGCPCADTMGNCPGVYRNVGDGPDIELVPGPCWGQAAKFHGNGNFVQILGGNSSGLEFTTMSLEFWVKASLGSNYDRIYQHNDGGTAGPAVFGGLSGEQIGVEGCNATWYTPYCGTDIFDSEWHHVVVIWDYNSISDVTVESWYVGGFFAASTEQAGALDYSGLASWSDPLIGAKGNLSYVYNEFVGTLDEVAIYDYALSEEQIYSHIYLLIPPPYLGDINWDGKVDFEDFAELGSGWMTIYDYDTLAIISYYWLEEYCW